VSRLSHSPLAPSFRSDGLGSSIGLALFALSCDRGSTACGDETPVTAGVPSEPTSPAEPPDAAAFANALVDDVGAELATASEGSLLTILLVSLGIAIAAATTIAWWRTRRRLKRSEAIRRQLAGWARNRQRELQVLERVRTEGPEGYGWNLLLDRIDSLIAEADERSDAAIPAERSLSDPCEILDDLPDGIAVFDETGHIAYLNDNLQALLDERTRERMPAGSADRSRTANAMGGSQGPNEEIGSATVVMETSTAADPTRALAGLHDDGSLIVRKPTVTILEGERSIGNRILRVARHPRWNPSTRELRGTIWIVRDVTQQKLAEKMRDEFLDSATHELRTPLANIKAYAETLTLSDVTEIEQQKEFCNIINAEATRLARLIDDLLSISSMEVGSLSVNCQRTEVDRLLKEVVSRVRPTMEKKQQKFHVLIDEKIPEMKLDKDKFATVLVNLLGNASKYTPEQGNVTLRARADDAYLTIEVEDTGVGISQEELPRIFEKFFRSDDPRVRAENGTGLGLSLTQELVRLHGGSLTVRSQIDQGTCFCVRMPL